MCVITNGTWTSPGAGVSPPPMTLTSDLPLVPAVTDVSRRSPWRAGAGG
jgi:hypothetical protein